MTTTPNRSRVAETVIAVSIVGAAWWTLALPAHERVADAHHRAADAQALLDSTADSGNLDHHHVGIVRDRVQAWTDAIADSLSTGALLQRAADASGVRIDRLAPTEELESGQRGRLNTATRRFEVVASGTAQSLGAMLDRIADQPLTLVRSFEMAPGPGADEVVAIIVIESIGITIAEIRDAESDQ